MTLVDPPYQWVVHTYRFVSLFFHRGLSDKEKLLDHGTALGTQSVC